MNPQQIVNKTIEDEYNKLHPEDNESANLKDKGIVVLTQDWEGIIPTDKDIPKFVKTPEYVHVITWLCTTKDKRIKIIELANQIGIHRNTITNWINNEVTKYILEHQIKTMVNKDRIELYEEQNDTAKRNPHMARFVAERYDNYEPKSNVHAGITINMNFINKSTPGTVIEADVITDKEKNE